MVFLPSTELVLTSTFGEITDLKETLVFFFNCSRILKHLCLWAQLMCCHLKKSPDELWLIGNMMPLQQKTKTDSDWQECYCHIYYAVCQHHLEIFSWDSGPCRKRHCNSHPLKLLDARVARPIVFWSPLTDSVTTKTKHFYNFFATVLKGVERYFHFWNWCLSSFADPLGTEGRASWILNTIWHFKRCRSSLSKYLLVSKSGTLAEFIVDINRTLAELILT